MFKYLFELQLKKSSFYKSEKVILKERTYFVHQSGDRNKIDLSFVTGIFSVFQKMLVNGNSMISYADLRI